MPVLTENSKQRTNDGQTGTDQRTATKKGPEMRNYIGISLTVVDNGSSAIATRYEQKCVLGGSHREGESWPVDYSHL